MQALTREQWDAMQPGEQMCAKLDFMAGKCDCIPLKKQMKSLQERIQTADTISQAMVGEYQNVDAQYKSIANSKTVTNARTPRRGKTLNRRQLAVREAYKRIRQGDVEFEGADAKFISLGNPHFKKLVSDISNELIETS